MTSKAATAIAVRGIGKQYRIGAVRQRYRTLRESLTDVATRPFQRAFRLLTGNAAGAADLVDTVWALRGIDFDVQPGEVVGVIGRNGAGKSTLLKILARITEPTEGEVRIVGRIGSLLEVGTGFHPELTGRENVYLSGAILGMRRTEIDDKLEAILTFAEVEKFAETPVKHYSSGMYLRLAFAVAAHLDPEILLIDEVLAVGDNAFRKKCLRKIGEVAGRGRTVLFVSHNMAVVQQLCSRTVVLGHGRVEFDGETGAAIQHYLVENRGGDGLDLADYRTSRGPGVFTKIVGCDLEGNEREVFDIGSGVALRIALALPESARDPQIGLGVNNVLGTRLFTVRPEWQGQSLGAVEGTVTVMCRFDRLQLVPGQYYLKATFGDHHSDFDVIEDLPVFEIAPSDYWGSGELPTPVTQGLIVESASWSVEAFEPRAGVVAGD